MKTQKYLTLLLIAVFSSAALLTASEPKSSDLDFDDFEVVEINTNEPAKKTTSSVHDVTKMIAQTEKKLNQIKGVVDSDELKGMARTLQKMKQSLHKMLFKNGPGFEIANKSKDPIWVTLVSNDKIKTNQKVLSRDKIEPDERFAMDMNNLKEDMKVAIYLTDPWFVTYPDTYGSFEPTPDYLYETTEGARGKTKYFTWNPEKHNKPSQFLYPQTGRLAGLVNVSSSKYSLSNNIKSHELVLMEQ